MVGVGRFRSLSISDVGCNVREFNLLRKCWEEKGLSGIVIVVDENIFEICMERVLRG